jgi:hypothetical protein
MASSTGIVLAAGGIVLANDLIFTPLETHQTPLHPGATNWRVIPATAILALTLGGLEKISKPLGVGLASLVLLAVLIVPVGHAPTPIDNAAKVFGVKG